MRRRLLENTEHIWKLRSSSTRLNRKYLLGGFRTGWIMIKNKKRKNRSFLRLMTATLIKKATRKVTKKAKRAIEIKKINNINNRDIKNRLFNPYSQK